MNPIDDFKGGLRDAAGAEEGGPVGIGVLFIKRVVGVVVKLEPAEPPGASRGMGIDWCSGEGNPTEF